MRIYLRIPLSPNEAQFQRLLQLQQAFASVCNALAPTVRASKCWNRVALHHMAYKSLREQFPAMGSQMVCNAIYSVSRASRIVYQSAQSPFNLTRLGDQPLPLLQFTDTCPVYFDRHTLSLKKGQLSMYTLDGRMRFQLDLRPEDETNFQTKKLREIVLARRIDGKFELAFSFSDEGEEASPVEIQVESSVEIPEYLIIQAA